MIKAYKICGFALLFVGILFVLPNAGILFKVIGTIPIFFAVYLLMLDVTLEIGSQGLIKTTKRLNFFKSIHSEPINQYKCLELSTKSNYKSNSAAVSTVYYSLTFLPVDENKFPKNDISMYLEPYGKSNMNEFLASAESISKITKLPISYSESFALEMERNNETAIGGGNNRIYYNLFRIFIVILFLCYMFREKLM